jgi:thiamine transport system ATP-binding protein
MSPVLCVEAVETRFGQRWFHYDFTLDGPGIVAISGPSGAGKSTLFHLLGGFEAPKAGRIILGGADVTALPPGKRPLTYIFQDHNLFAHLDLFTNVALGLSPSLTLGADDRLRVSAALADVGLAGFEKRMPQQLSGGERQRAAFARALVRRRPFLLLDEAFASLDEALRLGMGELLVRLQRDNQMMVLMISHDRREISRLAGRVVEIRNGRNVFDGNVGAWRQSAEFAE